MMPEGGAPARSKQTAALTAAGHDVITDEAVGDLLADVSEAELSPEEAAVVREIRREYEEANRVPRDLIEEISETQAKAQEVWQQAKADDDFAHFAPTLETIRDLSVERAEHIDPERDPYRVLYEGFEPTLPLDLVEDVFAELRDALLPLIEELKAAERDLATIPDADWDEEAQLALSRDIVEDLGYDFERGRLDTSPHPFTAGTQFDCRITTRVAQKPLESLTATIHEYGHASYQLGLPQEEYGSPLGRSIMEIHESQSRFWENHVGRTRAFWERYAATFNDYLGADLQPTELYEAANQIYPENRIRVLADELTYHLHIILRTEIEKEFVRGEIAVDDIPQVWNDKMERYLGVRPETDTNGCLQDIHWAMGGFAGFESYTIGSVLAAQLDAAMRDDLEADVETLIRNGEFAPLLEWMSENIHRHGQRYPAAELIERATGEPLTAEYFIEYVEEKFGSLYGL